MASNVPQSDPEAGKDVISHHVDVPQPQALPTGKSNPVSHSSFS